MLIRGKKKKGIVVVRGKNLTWWVSEEWRQTDLESPVNDLEQSQLVDAAMTILSSILSGIVSQCDIINGIHVHVRAAR